MAFVISFLQVAIFIAFIVRIMKSAGQDQYSGIKLRNWKKFLIKIEQILSKGIPSVGFVSPSHVVPQVKAIIKGLNSRGLKPITVYNTNSYDKLETIRSLSGLIDVYLT